MRQRHAPRVRPRQRQPPAVGGLADRRLLRPDGLQELGVVVEVLDDPGEHTGRRVLRREQHADDVVRDLLVAQERRRAIVAALLGLHQAAQQVGAQLATLPPLAHDVAQHVVQPPPRL